ncbi:MAG: bifunctional acetaldehyde-CoA/alcohol dehydrogenase [Planctomycetota bacterium]|nr:bifunctional acetaldehyde-CoA/alcohol dehydrogenase [Planctomycetota bacterium]MCX8039595.1 bifunctional acetaldehyde-CoA/alcohol dehydrogenase [Planctomycetota bacterium]MDW8373114.1 bifunctional acetaldehyde-CoA/alcohol dehydrogenase [Planctomycetota bacterium]
MIAAHPHEASEALQALETCVLGVRRAAQRYAGFSQEQVDEIFVRTAAAMNRARIELARAAVEETGMGVLEDKVIKNHFASETICHAYRDARTVGEVGYDPVAGVRTVLAPVGVVAAITPVTNPTSTAIFKILLALKTRNGIVIAPHPRAARCTALAARLAAEAATAAGAPEGLIACLENPTLPLTQALMRHPAVDLILATGGPGLVKAAYASGKPAIGVGAGNTPALVDESADPQQVAASVMLSKTFDNGVICASEQALVIVDAAWDAVLRELARQGAYLVTGEDRERLRAVLVQRDERGQRLNPAIVGQPAAAIARQAGIVVPEGVRVLMAVADAVGPEEPLSWEKLSPVLALYRVGDWRAGIARCAELVAFAGLGHTAVIYTAEHHQDRVSAMAHAVPVARLLVNQPSSHGAIGDLYNQRLAPSLTLGCGTWGGNAFAGNVGVEQLLNRVTVTERRARMQWYRVPPRVYHGWGCLEHALTDLAERQRAVIVTDRTMVEFGYERRVRALLERQGLRVETFSEVRPDPDLATVERGAAFLRAVRPDTIVALGGGSPIDAAKAMWLLYEQPQAAFAAVAMRFMDIRQRIQRLEPLGAAAWFVAIPTTSGTGSEVTPFAVITGPDGVKYPLADYALTPTIAIVDAELAARQPRALTAASGMDALSHALEALVSVCATPFTDGQALDAVRLLFAHLPTAWREGERARAAREQVHLAATLAGMAFANAFLGVCHALAHQLGARFHIPHGVANGIFLPLVIRYNAAEAGQRQAAFARYDRPLAAARYARVAEALGLGGDDERARCELLARAVENLRRELQLPGSVREAGVDEAAYFAALDSLAERAFDDQCLGTNPRAPLIEDLRALYRAAWSGG